MVQEPSHPGVVIKEVLVDKGLSISEAAKRLHVTRATLSRIINKKAGVSPEMALRLSKLLNTNLEKWLTLQMHYDIWKVMQHQQVGHA